MTQKFQKWPKNGFILLSVFLINIGLYNLKAERLG